MLTEEVLRGYAIRHASIASADFMRPQKGVSIPPDYPSLASLSALGMNRDVWYGFPSGLVIPENRLNWVWAFPGLYRATDYYLGTADQAFAAARAWKIDEADVVAVHEEDIHGTCVWEESSGTMVQARSFPHWCGV